MTGESAFPATAAAKAASQDRRSPGVDTALAVTSEERSMTGPERKAGISASSGRHAPMDCMKFVAVISVVLLHSLPTDMSRAPWIGFVDLSARFSVPFFLMASGYFFGVGQRADEPARVGSLLKPAQRLAIPYVFWLLVYLLAYELVSGQIDYSRQPYNLLLYGGPAFHLWYFPFLGLGLVLCVVCERLLGLRGVAAAAAAIGVFALLRGPYHEIWPDWRDVNVEPRIAASFALIGYYIGRKNIRISGGAAAVLAMSGFGLQAVESAFFVHEGDPFGYQHFLFGTFLYSAGVFFFALGAQNDAGGGARRIAVLGRLSLGVYCVHLLFIWLFQDVFGGGPNENFVAVFLASAGASVAAAVLLSNVPVLRPVLR